MMTLIRQEDSNYTVKILSTISYEIVLNYKNKKDLGIFYHTKQLLKFYSHLVYLWLLVRLNFESLIQLWPRLWILPCLRVVLLSMHFMANTLQKKPYSFNSKIIVECETQEFHGRNLIWYPAGVLWSCKFVFKTYLYNFFASVEVS